MLAEKYGLNDPCHVDDASQAQETSRADHRRHGTLKREVSKEIESVSHQAVQEILEKTLSDTAFRAALLADPGTALAEYDLSDEERLALQDVAVDASGPDAQALDQRQSKMPLWLL